SMTLAQERRTAAEGEGYRLAALAQAHVGLGEPEVAITLAREGIEMGRGSAAVGNEIFAILAFAQAGLASQGGVAHPELAAELERALELVTRSGMTALEPLVRMEVAGLARRRGDEETRERALREAKRLFEEMGAEARAAELAGELEPLRS
ncbi:MAG: hypothetical protein ACRDN8_09240, partial [Thermoleophilaceae bacterium]